ncbi:hypothetical protein [uncultured Legionella sp.]|uniref:hypothetical protein n=1 Tax=uncultured Legionella sp. TaxID=210934 RepID=UPI002624E039|nr:hypothetical protein [uncultured Legionella sp.]
MSLIKIDKTYKNKTIEHETKKSKSRNGVTQPGFIVLTVKIPYELKPNLDFEAYFNYLADGNLITIDTKDLPDLIKKGLIIPKKQLVRTIDFNARLSKHGFEVKVLPDAIQKLLTQFSISTLEERSILREQIREALESLVSQYFGMRVVAFDTVYRNTRKSSNNAFKSVPLTHIDFPEHGVSNTLDAFRKQWAPRVVQKLGDRYHARDIEFMINIWMPLDYITASPLALCANNKIDASRLHEYDAVRRDGTTFKAMSLTPPGKKSDPWFYRPGMKGQCYLFSSTNGIHSATEFPHEDGDRESIEVRLGIFKS